MNNDLTLKNLYDSGHDDFKPSRRSTIASSLQAYAQALGCDWSECAVEKYNLIPLERNVLIEKASIRKRGHGRNPFRQLSQHAIRNRKNDVSFALEFGYRKELLKRPAESQEQLEVLQNGKVPKRNETKVRPKYILDPVPGLLERELKKYDDWCTAPHSPKRPRKLKRRNVTHKEVERVILRFAGYLVQEGRVKAETLTLQELIDIEYIRDFVNWYITFQGRTTATVYLFIANMKALLDYLLIHQTSAEEKHKLKELAAEIKEFQENLDPPASVRDKSKRWLSLKDLQLVAESVYPKKAALILSDYQAATTDEQRHELRRPQAATAALTSVLFKMVLHAPVRQRNLREMLWHPANPEEGKNLYRRGGIWHLHFEGLGLKIGTRKGKVNVYHVELPVELNDQLEEYLFQWRPMLKVSNSAQQATLEGGNQEPVFLNQQGKSFTSRGMGILFSRTTYKYKGVSVTPHIIRSIWATEYLSETKDISVAAYMLGDSIQTVLQSYASLLEDDAAQKGKQWLQQKFATRTESQPAAISPKDLALIRNLIGQGLSDAEVARQFTK